MNIIIIFGRIPIMPVVVRFVYGGITDIRLLTQSIMLIDNGGYRDEPI